MAVPGMAQSHQAVRRKVRPAAIMKPQLITVGNAEAQEGQG
jgi:hypothetical protein